ncbi:hypothetical protein [Streptomyces kronopolitis]|uniref:hypothetical protein n=1 Tax=Streptomyces kronopolitis TaxID=1612435 RepID=UPI0034492B6F
MDLRPRALLARLNDLADRIDPDGQKPHETDDQAPTDATPDNADTQPDTAPSSADTVLDTEDSRPDEPGRGGGRLPNWWEQQKGALTDVDKEDLPSVPAPHRAPQNDEGPCEHPNPHEVHAQPTGELVAYWCEECETQLEALSEEEAEDGDDGGEVPAKLRDRWRGRGSAARIYQRPTYYDNKPAPKQSLIQWWLGLDAPTRWLAYNGTALGAGFYLGVPQFFQAETAYLVHTYGSWTDWHVCIWYGVAAGVWAGDHRMRGWLPPFALAARVPVVSMVIGCLLYGSTGLVL